MRKSVQAAVKWLHNVRNDKERTEILKTVPDFTGPIYLLTFSNLIGPMHSVPYHYTTYRVKQRGKTCMYDWQQIPSCSFTEPLNASEWLHLSLIVILWHCVNKEEFWGTLQGYDVNLIVIQFAIADTEHWNKFHGIAHWYMLKLSCSLHMIETDMQYNTGKMEDSDEPVKQNKLRDGLHPREVTIHPLSAA